MAPAPAVPRVVVVGAGFGGLAVVRALRRAPVHTTLVDQHNYHLFTPLLYQVASALLNPSEIAYPARAALRHIRNAEFRLGRIESIHFDTRQVRTDNGAIAYDYLVLAAGSVNNYFGNRSVEERSYALKDLEQALALRNRVLSQFEEASWSQDPLIQKRLLTFAVVGGGPTGVEYAGALSELVGLVLRKDFPTIDISRVQIVLIEATDRLLAAFLPSLQKAAAETLRRKGITVLLNAPVGEMRDGTLQLADGRQLEVGTVIWTAGVQGAGLDTGRETQGGRGRRVKVEPTLQLPGHDEVFVIGDMAEAFQDGAALPMLAPVAIQQGRWVAENIQAMIRGQSPRPFRYRDKGILATIGRNAAVAQIGPLHLVGFLGWVTWLFVHLIMIVGFRNRIIVLLNWAWDYFLSDRPIRLIARAADRSLQTSRR